MRKIPVASINDYMGEHVARDVFFRGFCLIPAGTELDSETAAKLYQIKEVVPFLFIDKEEEVEVTSPFIEEVAEQLRQRVELVMKSYSFEGIEDVDVVSSIMESIVAGLTQNKTLSGFNLDTFFAHQPDLSAHSFNTAIIAALLAIKSARFQRWIIEQITLGALLHDIGLAKILNDTGKTTSELSEDELHSHPIVGYNILKDSEYLPAAVKKIVLMHHVWEDPSASYRKDLGYLSYPESYEDRVLMPSTKGLPVSIVQVADTFESLTNLSGVAQMSKSAAIKKIMSEAEKVYGEGAILLGTYISPYGVGDEVKLNNGKSAVVVRQTTSPNRPVIKYLDNKGKMVDLRKAPHLKITE